MTTDWQPGDQFPIPMPGPGMNGHRKELTKSWPSSVTIACGISKPQGICGPFRRDDLDQARPTRQDSLHRLLITSHPPTANTSLRFFRNAPEMAENARKHGQGSGVAGMSIEEGKKPPYSLSIEQAAIASIMSEPEAWGRSFAPSVQRKISTCRATAPF